MKWVITSDDGVTREFSSGEIYQHQNGNLYRIVDVVWDCENAIHKILYQGLSNGKLYTRAVSNFFGYRNDKLRFERKVSGYVPSYNSIVNEIKLWETSHEQRK